ncbi:MAG: hypothetical protein LBL86_00010 [Coriobacteriales bacterium]|nr:hypothetical protein [Coriobacteriales bacterium]
MDDKGDRADGADAQERDAAFAHLEELLGRLEDIQEKDTQLARAREARELIALREEAHAAAAASERHEELFLQALRDAKRASDADDKEEEGRNLALVRMYDDLRHSKKAPMERARTAFAQRLKAVGLAPDAPLEDHALSDEELAALTAEVTAYQDDYARTYAFCKEAEEIH